MLRAFVGATCFVFLYGCTVSSGGVSSVAGRSTSAPPPPFVSVNPRSSAWLEVDTAAGVKKLYWEELSTDQINKKLPLERSFVSILKKEGDVSVGFATAKYTRQSGQYQVILDYAKYRDEIDQSGNGVKVGVGVRVIADITTKQDNIDLGSIFAIGLAAKAGHLQGQIEVLKIGIDSPKFGLILPPPTDINDASLQNALQAVAAVRARLFDSDTTLTPHILAEQYKDQSLKPLF